MTVTGGSVTPRDVTSMPPLPEWLPGYPRFRGTYGLAPADAIALCSICSRVDLGRGEVLYRLGDESDAMFVVRAGHMALRLSATPDSGPILTIAGPGVPFGNRALTTNEHRVATAYAVDTAELVRLGRQEFELLRRERPGVERFLVEATSTHVRFFTARADDLVEGSAERRVLRRLLELAYTFGGEPPVAVPLPQDDLAALAGVTRSTVNRVLKGLADQGLVAVGWRRLLVLDPVAVHAALQALPPVADTDEGAGPGPGTGQEGGSSPTPS
jgi:CRP-like cAMP-binding protein